MTGLRAGAMVLAYKQEEYIAACLQALAPAVDDVVVLHSEVPFTRYNPGAREQFTAPDATGEILRGLHRRLPNVTVVEGAWDDEPAARSAGLALLRERGARIGLLVDADEIYPDGVLAAIRRHIEADDAPGAVYRARYHTCYRRFDRIVESGHRLPVAVHIGPGTRFGTRPRRPDGPGRDLPDELCFWHMGYVLGDERMWEKIRTFSHAHEVLPDWYRDKWLAWTPQTRDLFRKHPASRWPRTLPLDPRRLPRVLHEHAWFPSRGPPGNAAPAGHPTLVVIGAMRSGTTSFHHLLDRHLDVFMSPIKGPGLYVDAGEPITYPSKYASIDEKRGHLGERELLAAMSVGYRGERHFGESTDLYTRFPGIGAVAPARMRAANPDARLIYLLRDPVERLLSQFRYERAKPRNPAPASLDDYLRASPDAVSTSCYRDQVGRYLDAGFDRAAIHLVVLEELVADTAAAMAAVMRFLDLPDPGGWVLPRLNAGPADDDAVRPTAAQVRRLRAALQPQTEGIEALLGRRIRAWGQGSARPTAAASDG